MRQFILSVFNLTVKCQVCCFIGAMLKIIFLANLSAAVTRSRCCALDVFLYTACLVCVALAASFHSDFAASRSVKLLRK